MRLSHMMTFLCVVEARGISRAAQLLNVAQSAVSRTIRELEAAAGTALLVRHPWGVETTTAGAALADRAKAIRAEAAAAEREIGAMVHDERRLLSIGTGPTIAAWRLPRSLLRLQEAGNDIRFIVQEGAYATLFPLILDGAIDAIIGPLDVAIPAGLVASPLYSDQLVALARSAHPLAGRGTVAGADIASCPWILPPRDSELWRQLGPVFQLIGIPVPRTDLETESIGLIRATLQMSDTVSILPRDLVELEIASGQLGVLSIAGLPWRRSIGIMHRQTPRIVQQLRPLMSAMSDWEPPAN